MKVFDYHINPRSKKGLISKSFCFQGETKEERALGALYIVAELLNSLSKDYKIINELSQSIRKEFFSNPQRTTKEALSEALKRGNLFLENLSREGNVRWLGNLNFAVFAIKNFSVCFSRAGQIKLLLLRGEEYHDIGENLEFQHPSLGKSFYPFSNIASGELAGGDKIIILTQDIFSFFYDNIAEKIIRFSVLSPKILNRIFKGEKEEMKKVSGIFLLILIGQGKQRRLPLLKIKLPFPKIKKEILLIILLVLILLFSYLIFR